METIRHAMWSVMSKPHNGGNQGTASKLHNSSRYGLTSNLSNRGNLSQ